MSSQNPKVTFEPADPTRIPDAAAAGALLLLKLVRNGVLGTFADLIKIRRQGGYCGLDVFIFFLLYFASARCCGIRAFFKVVRPHKRHLASLASRRCIPSPPSISRALDAVEFDLLRSYSTHILLDIAPCDLLLAHPATHTFDATGQPWHIFVLDPTVTTLRQRALPADDDLPEPIRRAKRTGKPGYSGRKRGDFQFRRTTVVHAGSGLFVHAHLSPGNGNTLDDLCLGLDSIKALCLRLSLPVERAMTRLDGEFGHVPAMSACRVRQMPFIVRLRRPALFNDPMVLRALREAIFYRVPDSLSGPRRAAADVGVITLEASTGTVDPDGNAYEPISVRVVASIFPKETKATAGKLIDGWQVELFGVDATANCWPAPEAVGLYFGRASQENRFAQEDRELGLDRIFSYELPVQELASVIGLGVWNLKVVEGLMLDPPVVEPGPRVARQAQVDERVAQSWPCDPVMGALLKELDWEALLTKRPGWSWDGERGVWVCPAGRTLALTTVRKAPEGSRRRQLIFRRPWAGCQQCAVRSDCLKAADPLAPKHVEMAIDGQRGDRLSKRLGQLRGKQTSPKSPVMVGVAEDAGGLEVGHALFLPASARKALEDKFGGASLKIEVVMPKRAARHLKLVAADVGERQQRRKTWTQNLARYALDARAQVAIEISGGHNLDLWLGYAAARSPQAGAG
jgi:hypothetical protein